MNANEFLATLIILGFIASVIALLGKLANNDRDTRKQEDAQPSHRPSPPRSLSRIDNGYQQSNAKPKVLGKHHVRWKPPAGTERPAPLTMPSMETVYLDTETTGLFGRFSDGRGKDEVVEITIIDDHGKSLVNSLVRPNKIARWDSAQYIHGISPQMVSDAPTLAQLLPSIRLAIKDKRVVIYNKQFDLKFLPPKTMEKATEIHCCMETYAQYINVWSQGEAGRQWHKLTEAAELIGYTFEGKAHRSLSDTLACRAVWRWMHQN